MLTPKETQIVHHCLKIGAKKAITKLTIEPKRAILLTGVSMKEQAFHFYLSRAYDLLREAEQYYLFFKYPASILNAHESMDSAVRAMCRAFDMGVPGEFWVDASTLTQLADRVGGLRKELEKELLGVMPSFLSYSLELFRICKYGSAKGDVDIVPPNLIFTKEHCEKILSDARKVAGMLNEVDMRNRWRPDQW